MNPPFMRKEFSRTDYYERAPSADRDVHHMCVNVYLATVLDKCGTVDFHIAYKNVNAFNTSQSYPHITQHKGTKIMKAEMTGHISRKEGTGEKITDLPEGTRPRSKF